MNRGVFTYSISFLIGIYLNNILEFNFLPLILVPIVIFLLVFYTKKSTKLFLFLTHVALFFLGASSISLNKFRSEDIYNNQQTISKDIQNSLSLKLLKIVPSHKEHSTICALTLGYKADMPYELKKSYINAGAMHVLALSGLHIGIIYSIVSFLLSFLNINYKGQWIKFFISIILISIYAYITGLSASVLRASIMILVYRLAVLCKRDKEKWNILAFSALFIAILSPKQATSVGFLLSFSAVIGIILLYPICKSAYQNFILNNNIPHFISKIMTPIWNLISISVCCQISTLPISLHIFGSSAQYFLLANIVAIPLATIILYIFVATLFLSGIPYIGDVLIKTLNFLLKFLNNIIDFIG